MNLSLYVICLHSKFLQLLVIVTPFYRHLFILCFQFEYHLLICLLPVFCMFLRSFQLLMSVGELFMYSLNE